ncbi:outer membrane efflux protein [Anaeromyxobacter sp. Fw109-5]|nr:outer membrane efflux protein [Anaeromyxobacter sp. Fw109-5]
MIETVLALWMATAAGTTPIPVPTSKAHYERPSESARPDPSAGSGEGRAVPTSTGSLEAGHPEPFDSAASGRYAQDGLRDAPSATERSRGTPTSTDVPTLPLADALAELDAQNLSVAQARARADEASGIVRQAASPLLPTLSAGASYTRNSDEAAVQPGLVPTEPGAPRPERIVMQPLEQFVVSGAARVPLVVPNAWFELSAARSGARAASLSAEATRREVRAGFAQAAHGTVAADEAVAASERAVESAAELARSAERRVAAGTAPPLDALRARTEQVRRESDLVRARAELERARLALGILLGRETPVRVAVPAGEVAPPADDGSLVEAALAARPELAAQRAQVDAAGAQVRGAWARLAPQLSAGASIFASDVPYPTGEQEGWRATVDLTWPLYDGGLRYGKRRQAEAQRAGAEAAAEAQRLAIVQQVRDALRDVSVARERLRLAETQGRLAGDAAASARRSYEAGVASFLDVIDANDRLYAADVQLADARARSAQARISLDRAAGRGP